MKKLVVMALAATFAIGANAAAVNWQATGTYVNNKTVYAFLESDRDGVTALLEAATSQSEFASSLASSSYAHGSAVGAGGNAQGDIVSSALTAGNSYDVFFVTISGSDPAYRILKDSVTPLSTTAYAETSPSSVYPSLSLASSSMTSSVKFSEQTGGAPEPTSGLLLLVGAGMLALRRKQK